MIIKEKIIKGKLAQLMLLENETTVVVLYDGEIIDKDDGFTWNNIKNEEWAQDAFIDFAVNELLKDEEVDEEFLAMLEEMNSEVIE